MSTFAKVLVYLSIGTKPQLSNNYKIPLAAKKYDKNF